jgi:CheY-like chemotaxis protein
MPAKILVVEDHADSREILKTQIRSLGYEVVEAVNGEEGLKKALAEAPNLIIMDLGLPGMNGIEVTAKLKENSKTANIPVVAHTAWSVEDYKKQAQKAGMAAYLTKPTSPQVLKRVIERFLQP